MTEHTLAAFDEVAALRRAADSARDAADHAAAIAHYGAALALLTSGSARADPHAVYELRLSRAACYHATGDYVAEAGALATTAGLAAALSGPDLLALLASQATTALENARLYEETLRANRELEQQVAERTLHLEQRNAELTLINSVQQALAAQLDIQAIFDLVGDKIREIFDAQVVDIGIYERSAGLMHSLYWIERGVRFPSQPFRLIGFY